MEALKLIPVLFSISTFNCTVDYFNELKLGDNYKPLNDVVDICAIVRSDNQNDEDLRNNVHHYIDKCEQNITKEDCKSTMHELLKSFEKVVEETARDMPLEERFVDGKLPEEPQNCYADTKFLNPTHLAQNYKFDDFFTLTTNELKDCFVAKVEQQQLLPQLIGIEFSYALQSEQFNVDETKKKYIHLMKSMDLCALECYAQIKFD
ncbi:unnamed protein product [Chironomus riparius]|uniref:Uncharacterized protein n=1 Tax=Chironomus riparius TaxID=315576 RepID=A0A9N9RYR7_9DIPT|nr:unnamed protein product [Chironomus riparius]